LLETTKISKLQLEEENIQLFTKIKFLQSYQPSGSSLAPSSSTSSSSAAMMGNKVRRKTSSPYEESRYNRDDDNGGGSGNDPYDVESKYDSLYERRMNPFAEVCLFFLLSLLTILHYLSFCLLPFLVCIT
jgi:hypothetical protein